jgi:hypothetical protein
VSGTAEGDIESAEGASELKMYAIEIGADGVEVLSASRHPARKLHPRLPVAEGAVLRLQLILNYPAQDGVGSQALSELYPVVLDLN